MACRLRRGSLRPAGFFNQRPSASILQTRACQSPASSPSSTTANGSWLTHLLNAGAELRPVRARNACATCWRAASNGSTSQPSSASAAAGSSPTWLWRGLRPARSTWWWSAAATAASRTVAGVLADTGVPLRHPAAWHLEPFRQGPRHPHRTRQGCRGDHPWRGTRRRSRRGQRRGVHQQFLDRHLLYRHNQMAMAMSLLLDFIVLLCSAGRCSRSCWRWGSARMRWTRGSTGTTRHTESPTPCSSGSRRRGCGEACAIGIVVALHSTLWLLVFVAFGAFVVAAYNLELFGGAFHSDVWFAVAWGTFPVADGVLRLCGTAAGRGGRRSRLRPDVESRATATVDAGAPGATPGSIESPVRSNCSRARLPCRTPGLLAGHRRQLRRSRAGSRAAALLLLPRRLRPLPSMSMALTTIFDLAFAAGILIAAASLALAAFRAASPRVLVGATMLLSAGAVAAWLVFALHQPRERQLAVAASGLLVCAIAAAASGPATARAPALRRRRQPARGVAGAAVRARRRRGGRARSRAGAYRRARADSVSLLVEEERRIAEERRREFAERERESTASLTEALTRTPGTGRTTARRVGTDLDRASEATKARIAELSSARRPFCRPETS